MFPWPVDDQDSALTRGVRGLEPVEVKSACAACRWRSADADAQIAAAETVLEANDVVFTQVRTALHFNQLDGDVDQPRNLAKSVTVE